MRILLPEGTHNQYSRSINLPVLACFDIEAARNRPNKPANATVNKGTGASVSELRKMKHEIKSISAEQLWSFQDKGASGQAASATSAGSLGAQLQKSQQLNEYCDRAVAEIRASLARSQNQGH